jgi:ABC-type sugar transport system ATPase subunit
VIKRIYADNYRCFTNFEMKPGAFQLLLGDNGAGKSLLLDLLADLRALVVSGVPLGDRLTLDDLTRWDPRNRQRFELVARRWIRG